MVKRKGEGKTSKIHLTGKDFENIENFAKHGLTLVQIAGLLEVSPTSLKVLMKRYPPARKAYNRGRANAINKVAKTAYEMATSGTQPAMTQFYLKTQAGWRDDSPSEMLDEDSGDKKYDLSLLDAEEKKKLISLLEKATPPEVGDDLLQLEEAKDK